MSLWEYKVITSGKGGFARPDLMEKFLNDLGRDEWEIIQFHSQPDNFLVFTGLARRSTQRDWTLEDAAAAAAKVEAEKLRAEFEAKFKAASSNAPAIEERPPSFLEEKMAPDDGFRKPVDTSRDDEPEAVEEEKDEWDKLTAAEEDELPTFFEAIKPHLRRNQRGPGMSVGVDYLAKKWEQNEDDLMAALVECGFVVPEDEDSKAEYVEYDGDLFWLNINRRGELWINTKEKPRPVFRPVKAARVEVETPPPKQERAPSPESRQTEEAPQRTDSEDSRREKPEQAEQFDQSPAATGSDQSEIRNPKSEIGGAALPQGPALLDKIRPHMRRNRRGPGGSGSTTFLARALRISEGDLKAAFVGLGLTVPSTPGDKPVYHELGNEVWWLNIDSRGGVWINGREKKAGEGPIDSSTGEVFKGEAPTAETPPGGAALDAVTAPDVAPSVTTPDQKAPTDQPALPAEIPSQGMTPSTSENVSSTVSENGAPASANDNGATSSENDAVAPAKSENVTTSAEAPVANAAGTSNPTLSAVRPLLKESRTGSVSAKVDRLAEELGRSADDLSAALAGTGMKVPEKPREKPVLVEHAGEVLWLTRNAKGELWLNAKSAKFSDEKDLDDEVDGSDEATSETSETDGEKKPARRGRTRTKKAE